MYKIGIDPGPSSGAIAVYWDNNQWLIKEFDKTDYFEINELLENVKKVATKSNVQICCVIEKQIPFSPPGVKVGVASIGKLMEHYGLIKGLLISNKIPFEDKVPRTWMKLYGMQKEPNETKTHWKNRLKARGKQLEPNLRILNNTSDAILIARIAHKFFE